METTEFERVWSVISRLMGWCLSAMRSPGLFLIVIWLGLFQAWNKNLDIASADWLLFWTLMYGLGRIAKAIEESNAIARSKQEAPKS